MAKERICKNCWFYEADGTKWMSAKTAEIKPTPNQEWCSLDNKACPASRTCPSWMSTAGNAPVLDGITLSKTKQEKDETKKEKRRLRKLAREAKKEVETK